MTPILITCYVNPDLDGVAGVMGYAEFLSKSGQDVVAGIIGAPHDEAEYILDRFHIKHPLSLPDADGYSQVILVDSSELSGLDGKIAPGQVIEIIDHRQVNEADKFPNAQVQIELVGAAATLIAEKFMKNNIPISRDSAIMLYGAIISNTFNFQGTVTTERDRQAAEWLNKTANLSDTFWRELFAAKSDLAGPKLRERIDSDFAWFNLGGQKVGIAQIEIIGAQKLIADREPEIISALNEIKVEQGFDFIFQNTVELEGVKNFFVASDAATKRLLEKVLNIRFSGSVAERPNLIMRKQIVPLLKAELEK